MKKTGLYFNLPKPDEQIIGSLVQLFLDLKVDPFVLHGVHLFKTFILKSLGAMMYNEFVLIRSFLGLHLCIVSVLLLLYFSASSRIFYFYLAALNTSIYCICPPLAGLKQDIQ